MNDRQANLIVWTCLVLQKKEMQYQTIQKGCLNGVLLFVSNALQTLTSIGHNALLTASAVVMVPYFSCFF